MPVTGLYAAFKAGFETRSSHHKPAPQAIIGGHR